MSILACFLLILIPYASSISFDFPNITSIDKHMFRFEGGANISEDGIQVTSEDESNKVTTGRATYVEQLHLWDKSSNDLASFSASFSFVKSFNSSEQRQDDGLIFFLARNSSLINGALGRPDQSNADTDDSNNQFVWVEFDPYCNPWETNSICDHVGINVNSHTSVAHKPWSYDNSTERHCHVRIEYDSTSQYLNVTFTGVKNKTVQEDRVAHRVDLREGLPEWVFLGFSASTGGVLDKNTIKSWMFNSSNLNNGLSSNKLVLMVGLIVGVLVVITLCAMLVFVSRRKKKNNSNEAEENGFSEEMDDELEMGATGPRRFSYGELERATSSFAEKEKIGEGSFGGVYKGFLKDLGTYVAIKRVSKSSKQGIKEYASEVRIISRLRHKNLVQLTGWCHEKEELMLVYEYMENGSLDSHLFKKRSLLTWGTRYKIVIGLASAILYLHEEWEQCVLHRDIKSSNVMLDSYFNAKLGDFGLAKLVDHTKGSQTTLLAGTLGYMAPECVTTGKATKESDVFSFGVVALEIACGRRSIDYKAQEKRIWLVEWVWELYGSGTLVEGIDSHLGSEFDEDEVQRLMIVGLWCVHPDSTLRPSIRQALQVLNSEAILPTLSSKMPVASYFTTPKPLLSDGSNPYNSIVDLSPSSSYLYGR